MTVHDELGKRMKSNYESIYSYRLTRRMPVIIRVDGKAFHSLLKNFKRPFDDLFMSVMNETTRYLCSNIQGCILGYVQSDEISLLLIDYKTLNTHAWFDNVLNKIVSISASMATFAFNAELRCQVDALKVNSDEVDYIKHLERALNKGGMFDSRAFPIPKEEVTNYFYWRQLDATRNSIEMVGQAHFSASELHKKTCNQIQEMLFQNFNINWNDFSVDKKRGRCCIKENYTKGDALRSRWIIDKDIPIFSGDGREYVEKFIEFE